MLVATAEEIAEEESDFRTSLWFHAKINALRETLIKSYP